MTDDQTLQIYDAKAREYAKLTKGYSAEDPLLKMFLSRLPPNASVLDLGCGPGASAAFMARKGLQVDAVDGSAEMVELAFAQPGVTARQARFDEIAGEAQYDGIWANFSLLHARRDELPGFLATLKHAIKPGGLFHIGMKLGSGEGPDALGRFYTYYSQPELENEMRNAGFDPFDRHFGTAEGLDGTMADWIVVHAHG